MLNILIQKVQNDSKEFVEANRFLIKQKETHISCVYLHVFFPYITQKVQNY